ncbi:hypothetical protein [Nitrosomonas sp.]|uniref:hypothetical protein n=1 Tax=Nitrosomonas sp. TaxID=42353 RepID=UPI0025FEF24E|nr:hypothetical protein [Nitrosomonas sp.]
MSALLIATVLCALNTAHADETLEYKLATINARSYVSKDHITVARFRSLLNQLASVYVEDKQQIADISVTAQEMLKKYGIEEALLNIMEGLNQLFATRIENQKYTEYAAAYVTLRSKGQSHSQAIGGLQAILRNLGVY